MNLYEFLSILFAAIALCTSAFSIIRAIQVQKQVQSNVIADQERELRNQLTEILTRLNQIRKERRYLVSKIERDEKEVRSDTYQLSALTDQSRFIVHQATYVMLELIKLRAQSRIGDMEFALVAIELDEIGDSHVGEQYWQWSVEFARSEFFRLQNIKGYARSLAIRGKIEEARRKYRDAITISGEETDQSRYAKAELFRSLALSESKVSNTDAADNSLVEANRLYEAIKDQNLKRKGMNKLELRKVEVEENLGTPS